MKWDTDSCNKVQTTWENQKASGGEISYIMPNWEEKENNLRLYMERKT